MNKFTFVVMLIGFSVMAQASSESSHCQTIKSQLDQLRIAQSSIIKSMIEDQKLAGDALGNFGTMVQMAPSKELVGQMDQASLGFHKRAENSQKTLERLEKLTLSTLEQAKGCFK